MEKFRQAYTGVSDVRTPAEARELVRAHAETGSTRKLMIGLVVSYKGLLGIPSDKSLTPSQITGIYEALKGMESSNVMFALHYYTKRPEELPKNTETTTLHFSNRPLSSQVSVLINTIYEDFIFTNPIFDLGLQLNMPWVNFHDIKEIRSKFPKLKIIVQISEFSGLIERMHNYSDADYLLVDASRGMGIGINIPASVDVYGVIDQYSREKGKVFAGAFSSSNVEQRTIELARRTGTKNFSIDAQSMLRNQDGLDLDAAREYLRRSAAVLG